LCFSSPDILKSAELLKKCPLRGYLLFTILVLQPYFLFLLYHPWSLMFASLLLQKSLDTRSPWSMIRPFGYIGTGVGTSGGLLLFPSPQISAPFQSSLSFGLFISLRVCLFRSHHPNLSHMSDLPPFALSTKPLPLLLC